MNFLRKVKPSSLSSLLRSKPPITHHHHHHKVFHNSFFTSRHQNQQLQHFPRRGGRGYYRQNWYRDPRVVAVTVVLSGGAAASVYFGNLETVPYTKRTHFVLLSPALERRLGEAQFEEIKNSLRRKILPAVHPDSVRVRLIAGEIVGALQRGLRHSERRWSDLEYSNHPFGSPHDALESEIVDVLGKGGEVEGRGWSREDEVLDDKWVHESRKVKGGAEAATRHLEGLNWEVVVVRDGNVNAFCLPGGKIVVFTGLLDHFRSDSEIATVIGHEVIFSRTYVGVFE